MKAYALILETIQRKASIRIIHIGLLLMYAAMFLIPFPPESDWQWGVFLFVISGCLLPLLLSSGIFGNDITSGRISLLVTKPIRPIELYLYRFCGLSAQVAIHLIAASAVILLLQQVTGYGHVDHFLTWCVAAWLVFHAWAALSTSLSVALRRGDNSLLLVVATMVLFYLRMMFAQFLPDAFYTKALIGILRYGGPSLEFLWKLGSGKADLLHGFGFVGYSILLTVLYCGAGIFLLGHREFKRTGD